MDTSINDAPIKKQLDELIETQNYFKFKERFLHQKDKLSKENVLYYKAIAYNVFNQLEESNNAINELLQLKPSVLTDTMLNSLYKTKLLNHINLYEYKEAANTSSYIQGNFSHINDSSDIESLENEFKIWETLKPIPKQEIVKTSDISFPMIKDRVGLFNIDVTIKENTKNFVFDTGANFSVIKRSLVEEFGLTFIETDFYVTAFTGVRVDSDLAIAKELKIGNLICKNVVFLVLNDEDISFPQIKYSINGIIGFPVIEAMDEIRISKNNTIFIPEKPINYNQNNFALDGLSPIIAVIYKKDTLSFGFDTGERETTLYTSFYQDYKQEIESKYNVETFKSGSVGGVIEFEGFNITELLISVGESSTTLNNIQLHKDNIGNKKNKLYGNLGQNYIKQFDEMIISFKYGSILFK